MTDGEIIEFDSRGERCAGTYVTATADDLVRDGRRPCVVMAHGFGATRDCGLMPFAQRFAAAGCDVLLFDYRGFGTSGGRTRQDVDHRRHRQDYHAAVAWVRRRPGVDPDRVVLWGSSYSGGHVVAVAARDRRIAGVISQGAAMDGLAALFGVRRDAGSGAAGALTLAGLRDAVATVSRRRPVMLPIVGEPGSCAVITAPGAVAGYGAIEGATFRNEMRARGVLRIAVNRPVTSAAKVTCPMLVVVAERDNIAPVSAVHRVADTAPRAHAISFPCGHFDIYVGDVFEKSVAEQVAFLHGTLA